MAVAIVALTLRKITDDGSISSRVSHRTTSFSNNDFCLFGTFEGKRPIQFGNSMYMIEEIHVVEYL